MENKINLVELLKDCPRYMELDCSLFNNPVKLHYVEDIDTCCYPITIITIDENVVALTEYGKYHDCDDAKCIIFPKGKPLGKNLFHPCKFKDGDVCYIKTRNYEHIFILKANKDYNHIHGYINLINNNVYTLGYPICDINSVKEIRFATNEERTKLFDTIKNNGWYWNNETKTLEELIALNFKVGDRIKDKQTGICGGIISIQENRYDVKIDDKGIYVDFKKQDDWELLPNKFDLTTLKPFDKVLVRDHDRAYWDITFYECYDSKNKFYPYRTLGGTVHKQCIPYKGNEDLAGIVKDCSDYYKTWINEENEFD